MCHQTVSLIARHLESVGIPTFSMASALDIIEAGNPPRAVFLDYPLGHSTGRPFDVDDQYQVVKRSLAEFERMDRPGTVFHLDHVWSSDSSWQNQTLDPAGGDSRQPRDATPQYQTEEDRRLAESA